MTPKAYSPLSVAFEHPKPAKPEPNRISNALRPRPYGLFLDDLPIHIRPDLPARAAPASTGSTIAAASVPLKIQLFIFALRSFDPAGVAERPIELS